MPAAQPVQAVVVEPEAEVEPQRAAGLALAADRDVLPAVRPEAVLQRAASAAAVRLEVRMLRRPLPPRRPVPAMPAPRRRPASAAAARALRRSSWRRVSFRAVTSA